MEQNNYSENSASFSDNKKKLVCLLSIASILKILLPERQINKKIYNTYELMINNLYDKDWIESYIQWELSLIKELGYEVNFLGKENNNSIKINDKLIKIPKLFLTDNKKILHKQDVKDALNFNRELLLENFINPNRLRFPIFRNILESYYT